MLKKLFKYEWKFFWKVPATINLALVIITLLGVTFIISPLWELDSDFIDILMTTSVMFYYLSIFAGSIAVSAYIAIRFYRSSYTDEGYLTHTLPVTPRQIILSKLFVSVIWTFITGGIIVISVGVLFITVIMASIDFNFFYEIGEVWEEFLSLFGELGFNFYFSAFLFLLLSVAGSFFNILMLFSAVSLGQMFSRHRIAGAVVWYIAEYTIVQFGSSILMSVTLLGVFNSIDRFDSFSSITTPLLCFGLLLTLAGDAVLYFITEYMMKKRLNLE